MKCFLPNLNNSDHSQPLHFLKKFWLLSRLRKAGYIYLNDPIGCGQSNIFRQ